MSGWPDRSGLRAYALSVGGGMTTCASDRLRAPGRDLVRRLLRARDHIDLHYDQPLNLDQVAAVAGVSKYHFARSFEVTYGDTPMRYLTRRRIERAQDLLRAANLTVTEVCMLVGFTSLGSFSSRFHQLVGESPTAYRDRWVSHGRAHVPGCYLFMRGAVDPRGTTGRVDGARLDGGNRAI